MKELIDKNISYLENNLELEKNIKLKSLIIMYLLMTRNDKNINILIDILNKTLIKDDNYRMNSDKYSEIVINFALKNGYSSKEIINNYIVDGYYFHSTNGAFYNYINTKGLILKDKPWDIKEMQKIKNIFSKYNKKDIFGLYQGEERTPIYLDTNISSSAYYSVSSPIWFLYFTSGGMNNKNSLKEAYRKRNYDECLKNIYKVVKECDLTKEETDKVIEYFNKQYSIFGLNMEPLLLLIKRKSVNEERINETKLDNESELEYVKRMMNLYCSQNIMLKRNIEREEIILIEYNKLKKIKTKESF